jgi:hypothetical protein
MSHHRISRIGATAWLLLLLASAAHASVLQTFSNRVDWEAATTGRTDIDFESLGLPQGTGTWWADYSNSTGLTTGGVNFKGEEGSGWYLWAINPPDGDFQDYNTLTVLRGPDFRTENGPSRLLVNLPSNVTSFGIDLAAINATNQNNNIATLRIYLDGIDINVSVTTLARPDMKFFGVTTDAPVSQVAIELTSGEAYTTRMLADNVSFGLASGTTGGTTGGGETPEATTLLYVASGAALMAWARRRRADELFV